MRPEVHRDPCDRMFATQCLRHSLPIVTKDPAFREFPADIVRLSRRLRGVPGCVDPMHRQLVIVASRPRTPSSRASLGEFPDRNSPFHRLTFAPVACRPEKSGKQGDHGSGRGPSESCGATFERDDRRGLGFGESPGPRVMVADLAPVVRPSLGQGQVGFRTGSSDHPGAHFLWYRDGGRAFTRQPRQEGLHEGTGDLPRPY